MTKRSGSMKSLITKNGIFYIISMAAAIGLKIFYSKAGSAELNWILAPTAWWVSILSGAPFTRVDGAGYVNHELRFLIAASCSGVQFMVITYAALTGSFLHRIPKWSRKSQWLVFSLAVSYLYTIFINGFRILLSIYLPIFVFGHGTGSGWLTPERLHTIIGITVYFTGLFCGCLVVEQAIARIGSPQRLKAPAILRRCIPPLFWYFSIVLGIPLLKRAYLGDRDAFGEYSVLLLTVCGVIILVYGIVCLIRTAYKRQNAMRKSG